MVRMSDLYAPVAIDFSVTIGCLSLPRGCHVCKWNPAEDECLVS